MNVPIFTNEVGFIKSPDLCHNSQLTIINKTIFLFMIILLSNFFLVVLGTHYCLKLNVTFLVCLKNEERKNLLTCVVCKRLSIE